VEANDTRERERESYKEWDSLSSKRDFFLALFSRYFNSFIFACYWNWRESARSHPLTTLCSFFLSHTHTQKIFPPFFLCENFFPPTQGDSIFFVREIFPRAATKERSKSSRVAVIGRGGRKKVKIVCEKKIHPSFFCVFEFFPPPCDGCGKNARRVFSPPHPPFLAAVDGFSSTFPSTLDRMLHNGFLSVSWERERRATEEREIWLEERFEI
jgi:hypothetical protein